MSALNRNDCICYEQLGRDLLSPTALDRYVLTYLRHNGINAYNVFRLSYQQFTLFILVPVVGLEPTRYCYQQILSLSCLPISTHWLIFSASDRIRTYKMTDSQIYFVYQFQYTDLFYGDFCGEFGEKLFFSPQIIDRITKKLMYDWREKRDSNSCDVSALLP